MKRKMPSTLELNRLYWLKGLSLTAIGNLYHATPSTVSKAMARAHIPRRSSRRPVAQCIEAKCEEPTCRVKRWTAKGYKFYQATRCAAHYHLWRNRYVQGRYKQHRQSRKPFRPRGPRVGLGRLRMIVKE